MWFDIKSRVPSVIWMATPLSNREWRNPSLKNTVQSDKIILYTCDRANDKWDQCLVGTHVCRSCKQNFSILLHWQWVFKKLIEVQRAKLVSLQKYLFLSLFISWIIGNEKYCDPSWPSISHVFNKDCIQFSNRSLDFCWGHFPQISFPYNICLRIFCPVKRNWCLCTIFSMLRMSVLLRTSVSGVYKDQHSDGLIFLMEAYMMSV